MCPINGSSGGSRDESWLGFVLTPLRQIDAALCEPYGDGEDGLIYGRDPPEPWLVVDAEHEHISWKACGITCRHLDRPDAFESPSGDDGSDRVMRRAAADE